MTYDAYPSYPAVRLRVRSRRGGLVPAALGAIALLLCGAVSLALLDASLPADPPRAPAARASVPAPVKRVARGLDPSFIDPSFTAGFAPTTFAQTVLPQLGFSEPIGPAIPPLVVAQADSPAAAEPALVLPPLPMTASILPVPVSRPAPRPAEEATPNIAGRRRMARQLPEPPAPAAPSDARGVFATLFGATPPRTPALAYAAPDDGGFGISGLGGTSRTAPDRYTAVYDIAAHTVTLPDGSRLEAHSGLGARMDDPRSIAEHMRGATPPAVYDLQPREALFHGVRALRLNPVGGTPYGRLGLLAHSYMLGPRGDSNGCVVFKDYQAFRRAYDSGQVRRLVVIASRS